MNADLEIPRTLLITLTGKDRPGRHVAVFATLARAGVEVLDIEQIVLRRRLILGVLVTAPARLEEAARRASSRSRADLGHERRGRPRRPATTEPRREGRTHVTVLGSPLKAAAFAAVAGRIADTGANIDRIERMARYPVTAIDLHVSGADPDRLRAVLAPRRRPRRASTSPSSRRTCCAAACG